VQIANSNLVNNSRHTPTPCCVQIVAAGSRRGSPSSVNLKQHSCILNRSVRFTARLDTNSEVLRSFVYSTADTPSPVVRMSIQCICRCRYNLGCSEKPYEKTMAAQEPSERRKKGNRRGAKKARYERNDAALITWLLSWSLDVKRRKNKRTRLNYQHARPVPTVMMPIPSNTTFCQPQYVPKPSG
jgi:hypothetical protein